jgi:hypothetical protein
MNVSFKARIMPTALKKKLLEQNAKRVEIHSGVEVRTRVVGSDKELFFYLYKGTPTNVNSVGLNGTPYRVLAYEAACPLLPIGRRDYRIVDTDSGKFCISGKRHDLGWDLNDKVATRVLEHARRQFRGIGRALVSISFHHAAVMGVEKALIQDVLAFDFWGRVSRNGHVVEAIHEHGGPMDVSEAEPGDENVRIDMEIDITQDLPQIEITLRTEQRPLALG